MASEIRVNKINSQTGVGTITLSPTGVDISGITTVSTLKVGTGVTASEDGDIFFTGVCTATTFAGAHSGSGANLTSLPAANLPGTIADARFPATLPAASAANLTSIPAANVTGTLPALTAANLTNIPAANIVGLATAGFERSGGFDSMTLLSTTSLSSSGSVIANVTSLDLTSYKYLYGQMYGVARSGGGSTGDIYIRFNGSSSNIYKYVMSRMDNNGSESTIAHNSQNAFYYNMTGVCDYSSTINFAHFTLHLLNEGSRKTFNMNSGGELSGGPIVLMTNGYWDNTGAVTSVEVQCSNTDINAGTLKLYGVK